MECEREFKCDQFKKIFSDNKKLVFHMRYVYSDKKDCSLCKETFSSKRDLKQPILNVHKTQEHISLC